MIHLKKNASRNVSRRNFSRSEFDAWGRMETVCICLWIAYIRGQWWYLIFWNLNTFYQAFLCSPPLEHRRHHKNKWSKKEDKKCNGDGVWSMPFFSLAKALLYSIISTYMYKLTCMQHLACGAASSAWIITRIPKYISYYWLDSRFTK